VGRQFELNEREARAILFTCIEGGSSFWCSEIRKSSALDVYEGEPTLPPALIDLDDVVITPHIAGLSPEAMQEAVERVLENLQRHRAGQALISPV
jgi:lactate dehydrogenase-like 2-hydroxyacid dehydrogenase